MVFVVFFFIGQALGQFFYNMFAHPVLFLLGLVRFGLVLSAIAFVFGVPLLYGNAGWLWVVGPIGLFLLFIQLKIRDFTEAL